MHTNAKAKVKRLSKQLENSLRKNISSCITSWKTTCWQLHMTEKNRSERVPFPSMLINATSTSLHATEGYFRRTFNVLMSWTYMAREIEKHVWRRNARAKILSTRFAATESDVAFRGPAFCTIWWSAKCEPYNHFWYYNRIDFDAFLEFQLPNNRMGMKPLKTHYASFWIMHEARIIHEELS